MTPLTHTEMMLAEPSAEGPYELDKHDHEALRRAISYYIGHLQTVGSTVRAAGGTTPRQIVRDVGTLDALYRKVVSAHEITITPDE